MEHNSSTTGRLIELARAGDASVLDELFSSRHRERLRMVQMRLDWRLHGRIDASDVIQEAYLEATRRLPAYLEEPGMPLFLWLRFLVGERLMILHRHHLGTKDARRALRGVADRDGATARCEPRAPVRRVRFLAHQPEFLSGARRRRVDCAVSRLRVVPLGSGEWGFSPLIEMGKCSLLVYWVHIEFVYGRLSILPKRSEGIGMATLGLITIFAAMTLLATARNRFPK